ncbi:prepilin-type N-terminal cleavage/methylation domain-containing protein [Pseudomonas sp. dw_358]|uniref:prepilin-type N-terminal cleavage/methylation domain-containing protein n=1 Tax=Pseudomonas sp. dw_358 TaxID=2720083 RepID=UPI001BD2336A|nr:prepilin-type N-terminal cleavage/methylation domain-containing protein [Pseudomonas sp. dw_358]
MKGGQRGFTLLEMLAALAVLALCASVLLVAFGQGARTLQQVASRDRMSLAARSVMDDLEAGPLQAGRREGQWDDLSWQREVSEVPVVAGAARLWRIDLTVRDGRHQVLFSTLRARSGGTPP